MFELFSAPRYASENEASFCRERRAFRQLQMLHFAYFLTLIIQSFGFVFQLLFFEDPVRSTVVSFHAACLTAALAGLALRRHRAVFRWTMIGLYYLAGLGAGSLLYLAHHVWHIQALVIPVIVVIVGVGIMSPPLFPGSHLHTAFYLVTLASAVHLALQPADHAWAVTMSVGLLLVYGFFLRVFIMRFLEHAAQATYRFRSQVVPEHIVRHSADEATDVDELFKAKSQFCVCISSDWRNYQKLSAGMPAEALIAALDEYYELTHRILRRLVPEGRYFTDWIADELFVVIYGEGGVTARELVNTGVRFGLEMLEAKAEFQKLHGIPEAIDVGVASGVALIGLMGPQGHRKATAIGEVPGRARRLQSAGKLVRQHQGEADRVIFGEESLMRLTEAFAVVPFALSGGKSARDLNDPEIYVVEREAAKAGGAPVRDVG
jgi:class 3 adenylate cyclase